MAPRGKYRGERIDKSATDEREHFERCLACGAWIDLRPWGLKEIRERQVDIAKTAVKSWRLTFGD
jgi:hypothetical protein